MSAQSPHAPPSTREAFNRDGGSSGFERRSGSWKGLAEGVPLVCVQMCQVTVSSHYCGTR